MPITPASPRSVLPTSHDLRIMVAHRFRVPTASQLKKHNCNARPARSCRLWPASDLPRRWRTVPRLFTPACCSSGRGAAVPFQRFTVEIGSGDPGGFGLLMRCQLKLPIPDGHDYPNKVCHSRRPCFPQPKLLAFSVTSKVAQCSCHSGCSGCAILRSANRRLRSAVTRAVARPSPPTIQSERAVGRSVIQ